MKKVLIASGIAVLAFVMVAGAQGYTFNTNLTVGSTGADVVALQTWLMAQGYSIPALSAGTPKGYFGSQTKAAVSAMQVAKGIANPGTGFVGPLTRGFLNSGTVATPVAGNWCLPGYVCTPAAGTPSTPVVTNPGVISTPGAEGLITTKLASSPIADANIRVASNVPVWGVEVKAQGSDMIVDRVLIQMAVGVGGAATSLSNPSTFVRTLYDYDGSTLLKSWNLSAADFNKDSSDRYYVIASGLRFVVPKETTKVLTFTVDTVGVSADQSSRYLTVQGYVGNTQNVRAVDGAGMNTYTDMSGTSNSRVQIFTTSGTSALTATLNSALTPKAQTNRVSTTDGVKGLIMQIIDVKSETGASVIKNVNAYVHATATAGLPSTLYLYDGSTLLSSVSAPASDVNDDVNFTDLNIRIGKDETKQLTIKADFPTTAAGQAASTSIPVSGIKWEKPDSTTASTSPTSALTSNDQYLYTAAPKWELVSQKMDATAAGTNSTSSITGTIVLRATAIGGAMTKPTQNDFTVVFASSTQANGAYVTQTASGANALFVGVPDNAQVTPTDATVGEGGTYTVTITTTLTSATTSINGSSGRSLFMAIKDIDSVVGGSTFTNQTWGIDTFYTDAKFLPK